MPDPRDHPSHDRTHDGAHDGAHDRAVDPVTTFATDARGDGDETTIWRTGPVYSASDRPVARLVARPLREFLRIETAGSVFLIVAALVALVWANSPWGGAYDSFWHAKLSLEVGPLRLEETLQHWVNDALMVLFFFVVGLEIKYELVAGDLRDPRTAALPVAAAIGGMAVPALIYLAIAGGPETGHGWGIPMATDIAFAVGVIGLLGHRIPSAARLFLLTLAIVDDIGAILVIAVFYTDDLSLWWLLGAVGLLAVMVLMRALRVWAMWAYAVVGVLVWFAMLESGVHATLAGVAVGLIAPTAALLDARVAREYASTAISDHELDADEVARLRFLLSESVPVVERLQNALHPLSAYVVLPVFALANAGVDLGGGAVSAALESPVALGVALGLLVGKPLGITVFAWLAVRSGLATMPDRTTWPMVVGLGLVAGVGFTVSLFIAGLSFADDGLTDSAKVGILGASLLAGVAGALLLRAASPVPEPADDPR